MSDVSSVITNGGSTAFASDIMNTSNFTLLGTGTNHKPTRKLIVLSIRSKSNDVEIVTVVVLTEPGVNGWLGE